MKHARLWMILSMGTFGTLAPFVRNIRIGSGQLALYRAILAAVLIGVYLALSGNKIVFRGMKKEIPLLVVSGMAMGINWIFLFEAYKYTTISVATLSYYFAPVIVMVVCPLLFREQMGAKQILCFAMSTLGLVLIIGIGDVGKSTTDLIGILFGLGAAVFYATVILVNKFIKQVGGIQRTFLQFLAAIVILVPYVAVTGGMQLQLLDGFGWANLLIVGLIHTGVTYCLYFSSLAFLPGQKVAVLSYIDPLVAVMVSVGLLGEPITLSQMVGGGLILGFTLLNEVSRGK